MRRINVAFRCVETNIVYGNIWIGFTELLIERLKYEI